MKKAAMMKAVFFSILFLMILNSIAYAVPVYSDLSLHFSRGPLTGQTFTGEFSVEGDNFTGIGTEVFAPLSLADRTGIAAPITSFDITVDNSPFSLSDVVTAGLDPFQSSHITFQDGTLSEISLNLRNSMGARLEFEPSEVYLYTFNFYPAPTSNTSASSVLISSVSATGSLTLVLQHPNTLTPIGPAMTAAVPEPSTMMLFGSGLLGLVTLRYKKRKSK